MKNQFINNQNFNETMFMNDEWKSYAEYKEMEDAIEAFKNGEFLIVSDNEDRENEGDLIIAAEHATPEAINFMITEGKGLVCVTVKEELAQKFGLHPMVEKNTDHNGTAFTISIDATLEHGVTTGISAQDRSKTIQLLIDENSDRTCMQSPGHIFPLIAKPGGVLERDGHTEAGVELAELANLAPAAVIVEIIKKDGTMARRPDLVKFAAEFNIRYITIENLKKYVRTKKAIESLTEVSAA